MNTAVLREFESIVGPHGLISSQESLRTYECDALTNFRVWPQLRCVLPTAVEEVQGIVRICHRERIPFVARGSGTGLSGGALPVTGRDRHQPGDDEPDSRSGSAECARGTSNRA